MRRIRLGCLLFLILSIGAPPCAAELRINEFMSCNTLGIRDQWDGTPDWIEIINTGPLTENIAGYGLSDDQADPFRWLFPSTDLAPGETLLVFATGRDVQAEELHCNFTLTSLDGTLSFVDDAGAVLDLITYSILPADISLGRVPGEAFRWFYFTDPSPGEANLGTAFKGFSAKPDFSVPGGHCVGSVTVAISSEVAGDIRFTLNGAIPNLLSSPYTDPLLISGTSVLRAACLRDSMISMVATRSYFFGEDDAMPLVSLVSDPVNLWDEDYGMLAFGDDYDPDYPYYGANFWEDWERPAHIEFYETDGTAGFDQDLGIKVHGNYSRGKPQKSLRLYPRGGYGDSSLDHLLFSDKGTDEFSCLILRNSGNDWSQLHFRDACIQYFSIGSGLDYQAYRPARMFINGEYWGILNIRERQDVDYLRRAYGISAESIDLLVSPNSPIHGSIAHYQQMLNYIETHGLQEEEHYRHIQTMMDTDNYAAYNIYETYFGNTDWPAWNLKFWRSNDLDGRWRWMLVDLDFGLGLYGDRDQSFNFLAWALDDDSPNWVNCPAATFLLRNLMSNAEFKRDFVNRHADLLNTRFLPDSLMEIYLALRDEIDQEILRHFIRWEQSYWYWEYNQTSVESFIDERPDYARQQLISELGLGEPVEVSFDISPPGSGSIELCAISVEETWSGTYFAGNDLPLHARPAPDHHFVGWSLPGLPPDEQVLLDLSGDVAVTAIFERDGARVLINEINYHPADNWDCGDWIELFNPDEQEQHIGDWEFRDDDDTHVFTLPPGTVLGPGEYLVLCREQEDFLFHFPLVENSIGDFVFGLSGDGEVLRLFDDSLALVDRVEYSNTAPWPVGADGTGATLQLINPYVDNDSADNWQAPEGHGSPGEQNDNYMVAVPENPAPGRLLGAYPNPFNPRVEIRFSQPQDGRLSLRIFDCSGRLVRSLVETELAAGEYTRTWSGDDERGIAQPSGVYLMRLEGGGGGEVGRLVLLR